MLPALAAIIGPMLAGAGPRILAGLGGSRSQRLAAGKLKSGIGEVTESLMQRAAKPNRQNTPPENRAPAPSPKGVTTAAPSLFGFGRRKPEPAQPAGRGFAALAARPGNFGDLLSGKKSQEDVEGEDASEHAKAAAQEKVLSGLKKFSLGLGLVVGGSAALLKLPGLLDNFGKAILSGQEYLRRFNGQIANSFALLERQKLQLAVRTGASTSGTTETLIKEQMRFNEEVQPIREAVQNIWNIAATGATKLATWMTAIIKAIPFAQAALDAINANTKKEAANPPWVGFVQDLANRKFAGKEPRADGGAQVMGTNLTYNYILLQNVLTKEFDQELIYDESGTDPLYQRTMISVLGYVHDIQGAGPGGVFPQNGFTTTDIYNYVKSSLLNPRGNLLMTVGSATLYQCDPSNDVNNGPKPKHVRVTKIAGSKVFLVEFTIECAKVDCLNSSNSQGVLNNRWSLEDAIDYNLFTTRTLRGKLRLNSITLNPQTFRDWVLPPLQLGFRRDSMDFVTTPDGLVLEYAVVDSQQFAAPPPGVQNWTCDHTEGTNDGVTSTSHIAIHLEGKPSVNKQQLISVGAQIVQAILAKQPFDQTTLIEQCAITDHMHNSSIDFQMTIRQTNKTPQEYYTANLQTMGKPLVLPGYDPQQWPVPSDVDIASPTGLLISYLQTPCNDNHMVSQAASPSTAPITSPRDGPRISTSTGILTGTGSPGWSTEQLTAAYTHYSVESHYDIHSMRLALPIAAAASGSISNTTRSVVTLGPPNAFRVVKTVAERFGTWPNLPPLASAYQDPTGLAVLVDKSEVKADGPLLSNDGSNRVFNIEQTLIYSLQRAPADGEFRAAALPWMVEESGDRTIPVIMTANVL